MIGDAFLQLSNNQAPVNSSGTTTYPAPVGHSFSANYVDLLQARDLGDGADVEVQLHCTEALSADQTWVVTFHLGATPYALAGSFCVASMGFIGGSATTYAVARPLVLNDRIVASLSPLTVSLGARYLYAVFTNLGGTTSVLGKFTIDVCSSTETTSGNLHYPGGFAVR